MLRSRAGMSEVLYGANWYWRIGLDSRVTKGRELVDHRVPLDLYRLRLTSEGQGTHNPVMRFQDGIYVMTAICGLVWFGQKRSTVYCLRAPQQGGPWPSWDVCLIEFWFWVSLLVFGLEQKRPPSRCSETHER
jgi:hypothetical protein